MTGNYKLQRCQEDNIWQQRRPASKEVGRREYLLESLGEGIGLVVWGS